MKEFLNAALPWILVGVAMLLLLQVMLSICTLWGLAIGTFVEAKEKK